MKAAFITAFFALFFSVVFAQSTTTPFYITSPLQGDSFKAGSTLSLQWNNGVSGNAKVTVLTGTNAATMKSAGVTFTINGSDGEYAWKVPSNLPQNATFAFEIDYTSSTGASASSFSSPFSLTGTTGPVVTQSFVSIISSAAVSSAAPSSVVVSSSPIIVLPSTAIANATSAVATASASTTPAPTSAAIAGFKAPIVAVCVIVLIASALFL